jgi:hypothetical protein
MAVQSTKIMQFSSISKQSCPKSMYALIVAAAMLYEMVRFFVTSTIFLSAAKPATCPFGYNAIGARSVRRHGSPTFLLLTER